MSRGAQIEFVGGPIDGAIMSVQTDQYGIPPDRWRVPQLPATETLARENHHPQEFIYRRRETDKRPARIFTWKYDLMKTIPT